MFVENGVASPRLVAIGRAENRPVASNDHADGRARNRRVTISILPESAGDNDLVPVATLGNGSRTNQARRGSAATGNGCSRWRCSAIERAQPVQPVPVATITPDEE